MVTVAVTTQPTYRVGPNTGFKATGTIQGQDAEFKDDLLVQGDAEVVGTLYGAAISTSGHLTVAANKNIVMGSAGSGSGTIQTGTGTITVNGDINQTSTKTFTTGTGLVTLNGDVNVAAGKYISMSGAGTFTTGTGAVGLNGTTTVISGKVLAVTDADKLTVGGVIVPQTLSVMAEYKASDVDHTIFIADATYTVVGVKHMAEVVDTAVGAATVGVMKCTGTQAASGGVLVTTAACDMKTVTQTVTNATVSVTGADLILTSGNRLALDFTGNTDGTGIVMVTLKRT